MIVLEIKGIKKPVYVYNEWDMANEPQENVLERWDLVTKADVGKFIKFNDGSDVYTKILGVNEYAIRTEIGPYPTNDVVYCFKPRCPYGTHVGLPYGDVHFKIRKPGHQDKTNSSKIVNGTFPYDKLKPSRRVRMLALEKLAAKADEYGITEDFVVKTLKKWVDSGNRHGMEALKSLCRIKGIELNQQQQSSQTQIALFTMIEQGNTIQDDRRNRTSVPTARALKEIVQSVSGETGKD